MTELDSKEVVDRPLLTEIDSFETNSQMSSSNGRQKRFDLSSEMDDYWDSDNQGTKETNKWRAADDLIDKSPSYVRRMRELFGSSVNDETKVTDEKPLWRNFRMKDRFFHRSLEVRKEGKHLCGIDTPIDEVHFRNEDAGTKYDSHQWRMLDKKGSINMDAMTTGGTENLTFYKAHSGQHRRIAFFDGQVSRVSKVNTAEEQFGIDMYFFLTWLMSKDEVTDMKEAKKNGCFNEKWQPKSHPQLECLNLESGQITRFGRFKLKSGWSFRCLRNEKPNRDFKYSYGETSWDIRPSDLGFDPRFAYWCRVQYDCQFTCSEPMELDMFPFDCQDFTVHFRLKQKANLWDVLPMPMHREILNVDARYLLANEWRVVGSVLEFKQGDPSTSKTGIPFNGVVIRVKAERRWQVFIIDGLTTFCMFWLGLGTFGIPVEDVADRLAYCITLLLTDVSSMQLLKQNVPYRTMFDSYASCCFVYLVSITVYCTFAGTYGSRWYGRKLDYWFFWIFCCVAVLIHFYFSVNIWIGRKSERSKLKMNSSGLDRYFKTMSYFGDVFPLRRVAVHWASQSLEYKSAETGNWDGLSYPWSN